MWFYQRQVNLQVLNTDIASPRGITPLLKHLPAMHGSQGSNPDVTKVYSAPILSGTPPHALSLTMPEVMRSRVNTFQGEVKRE